MHAILDVLISFFKQICTHSSLKFDVIVSYLNRSSVNLLNFDNLFTNLVSSYHIVYVEKEIEQREKP